MTNRTTTTNGAATFRSSSSALLNLFANGASMRGKPDHFMSLWNSAFAEDNRIALQLALWLRDVRGGAGERESFRQILKTLNTRDFRLVKPFLAKVAEVGRWDDLLHVDGAAFEQFVIPLFQKAKSEGNGLWAKWMPVKGFESARVRRAMGYNPRDWRKMIVGMRNTVEQKMCSHRWEQIVPKHVPGVAMKKYFKAFFKRIPTEMEAFKTSVQKGEVKMKSDALYPYDVLHMSRKGLDPILLQSSWDSLPDYVNGAGDILPIIDTSSSMDAKISPMSSVSCMDAAISLGIYVTERQKGIFKDHFITFASNPSLVFVDPTLKIADKFEFIRWAHWGGSTNVQATFDLILQHALRNKVDPKNMPKFILLISDMQFNQIDGRRESTALEYATRKFKEFGYERPKFIFWQVNGNGHVPATTDDQNVAMYSGFSPSILKSALSQTVVDPFDSMMETIDVPRYQF